MCPYLRLDVVLLSHVLQTLRDPSKSSGQGMGHPSLLPRWFGNLVKGLRGRIWDYVVDSVGEIYVANVPQLPFAD